jgi:hypothetical protein
LSSSTRNAPRSYGPDDDPLQKRVYDWERACVDSRARPEIMSREQCASFIRLVVRSRPISVRSLRFTATGDCYATPAGLISIADWGRTKHTILHELAHLVTFDAVAGGEPAHGESFVLAVIELYAEFLGLDVQDLSRSAQVFGVLTEKGADRLVRKAPSVPYCDLDW